jgi:hypothetical protein
MPKAADPLAFLFALNLTLAAKEKTGGKITPPGLLSTVKDPTLTTRDCVEADESSYSIWRTKST